MASGFERYSDSEIDPLLRSVCYHWNAKIRQAIQHKREVFGIDAEECANFYNGPRTWDELMMGIASDRSDNGEQIIHAPDFKVKVNKTFEFVTIFGPALYYENPVRTCKPRMPVQIPWDFFPNPQLWQAMVQADQLRVRTDGLRGVLLETYLNWTPLEFRLDRESRAAIDEALIKGRGCLWTELYQPPGSPFRVVRSKWESVDDLIIDPDATSLENAMWIARRRCLPSWWVERDYGLRKGSIRGNLESQAMQVAVSNSTEMGWDRRRGMTNDLLVYYEVWSRMGLGGRLWGQTPQMRASTEPFGDFCYMVVAENVPFPLNCSPDVYNDPSFATDPQQVFGRFAWPTPFWYADRWPVSCLDFHKQHNSAWPLAHLKAGMGELKFLNWAMSFLMGKIRTTSRDFIAVKKAIGEEIKTALLEGKDLTLLEIDATQPGLVTELIQFLQHPAMNGDIWKVIEAVENNFDKRVGLTELMYGDSGATQIRSAAEITVRNQNMNVRPADMAKNVEAWMSEVAVLEAIAARYHLRGDDVKPLMGDPGAFCWNAYVATLDLGEACRQLEYRVEAGSTQRPNAALKIQTMQTLGQQIMPVLQAYASKTGDLGPVNNWISDLCKALSLDPNRYMLRGVPGVPALPGSDQDPEPGGTDVAQPADAQPTVTL